MGEQSSMPDNALFETETDADILSGLAYNVAAGHSLEYAAKDVAETLDVPHQQVQQNLAKYTQHGIFDGIDEPEVQYDTLTAALADYQGDDSVDVEPFMPDEDLMSSVREVSSLSKDAKANIFAYMAEEDGSTKKEELYEAIQNFDNRGLAAAIRYMGEDGILSVSDDHVELTDDGEQLYEAVRSGGELPEAFEEATEPINDDEGLEYGDFDDLLEAMATIFENDDDASLQTVADNVDESYNTVREAFKTYEERGLFDSEGKRRGKTYEVNDLAYEFLDGDISEDKPEDSEEDLEQTQDDLDGFERHSPDRAAQDKSSGPETAIDIPPVEDILGEETIARIQGRDTEDTESTSMVVQDTDVQKKHKEVQEILQEDDDDDDPLLSEDGQPVLEQDAAVSQQYQDASEDEGESKEDGDTPSDRGEELHEMFGDMFEGEEFVEEGNYDDDRGIEERDLTNGIGSQLKEESRDEKRRKTPDKAGYDGM